ncbi:MAG: GntR family transcriptional regulator [Prolixibacteraceae bacterium]|nr:GntR family transcriptional regulator [Prolixibacteraceae bacterium]
MNQQLPKYQVIVNAIEEAVRTNTLSFGDQVYSLNGVMKEFSVSRDTAVAAYKILKTKGVIDSTPGKGYFIATSGLSKEYKVFLFFDELEAYKEVMYNAFIETIGNKGTVEIFFHHFNKRLYETILYDNAGKYTDFVIIPHPGASNREILPLLSKTSNVFILDQAFNGLDSEFPAVFQRFGDDFYIALQKLSEKISNYSSLKMVIKNPSNDSEKLIIGELMAAFKRFSGETGIKHKILRKWDDSEMKKNTCFILHADGDLVKSVKSANRNGLETGKDIGIISFNETPLKEISANGITTISTDFEAMGKKMAEILLEGKKDYVHNESKIYLRKSL